MHPLLPFQAGFKPVPFPAARSPRVHLPSPLQGRQLAWTKTCQPDSNQNPARQPAREQKKKNREKKKRDVYCASSCIVTVLRIVYVVSKRYATPGLHGTRSIVYVGGRLGHVPNIHHVGPALPAAWQGGCGHCRCDCCIVLMDVRTADMKLWQIRSLLSHHSGLGGASLRGIGKDRSWAGR